MCARKNMMFLLGVLMTGLIVLAACSTAADDTVEPESYTEDSTIGMHEAMNTDISDLNEISITSCAANACHGGSYDEVKKETEEMWQGVGQIADANPHSSHASNAFVCENCHNLSSGSSVNQCNGCHDFESPVNWIDKDPTTTIYGIATDEPRY